ncbi:MULTISPECIES: hypothetical protein [Bacillus subtilis group]|uniref:Uncharacterized protein n=1 Tax=Bacillus subtilis TaxID=1423 RepID=A0A0D1KMK6_BACIU|nr:MULTISPECIES: hypothetical protein [Bacillus subtilis group]KIU04411.1 hypothetical protein SC09_contig8orf00047 [Bacillus subtilis]KTF59847.1 hypothetical protein AR691_14035 [Bacillus amyloliquefaciens]MCL9628270.1 hypothetical protein [Bacillus subtilis]
MEIEIGKYYALDYTDKNGFKVTHIIKTLPNIWNLNGRFVRTQTLKVRDGQVDRVSFTNWVKDDIQREATDREIEWLEKEEMERLKGLKNRGL